MAPRCVVDTNVPKTANKSINISELTSEELGCVLACVNKIENIMKKKEVLVLDTNDEIYYEYIRNLKLGGDPGLGNAFMKWVHDNQWKWCERVEIKKEGNSYREFPDKTTLRQFDISDRKFVAVSRAHSKKPSIAIAIDRGWWIHRDALRAEGIEVYFLCPNQIEQSAIRSSRTTQRF